MYDYEHASEEALIRKAKRGDAKAFAMLYSQIYRDLYRFALYMLRHPQDAEDAVGETVISAYENISKLKKEKSFKNWLFTILSNRCKKVSEERKKAAANQYSERNHIGEDHNALSYGALDFEERHEVRNAFSSLDEEEQRIVAFSVFGGYQSDEIAAMTGSNAATVRSRKSRALRKMRSLLESGSMERRTGHE